MEENKKTIMIDMDEVLVCNNFTKLLEEFLGKVDFSKLTSNNRQDLIKGREEEFKEKFKYENLYKNNNEYIEPIKDSVRVIKKLNEKYNIYIVTSYIWKNEIIDSSNNLKNKFEYLQKFFPFLNINNFIFIQDKTKLEFDIGIDDRINNLKNCKTKLLFNELRNEKISKEELKKLNTKRVLNWNEVEKELL